MGTELCYLSPSPPGGCLCIDCYTQRRSLISFTLRSLTSVLFHRGRKRAFVCSPSSLSVCLAAGLEGEMKSRTSLPVPPPFLSARKAAHQWRWRRLTTGAAQTSRRLTGRRGLGNEVCPFITLCSRFTFESPKKKNIIREGTAVNILKPDTMVTWDCDVEHTYYICWLSSNEPHEPITGALVN